MTIIHRMYKTKTYKTWESMKYRCNDQNNPGYKDYGGRGDRVKKELIDLTGKRFGRLIVKEVAYRLKENGSQYYWKTICDCGNEKTIRGDHLKAGLISSCRCLQKETATKHNLVNTPTWYTWRYMRSRCLNPQSTEYENYGGRGIKICKRWDSFINFFEDMGWKPEDMTIDRINNDGDYTPENCRWATKIEQCNNTRRNVFIRFKNIELTISQWAKKLNINRITLGNRIRRGWTIERALTQEVQSHAN